MRVEIGSRHPADNPFLSLLSHSTTIIGTLSQTITYGTILPFYLFLHLFTSPTNLGSPPSPSNDPTQDFLIDPAELAAWAPAFTISYLLPTILVMLPSPTYTSWSVHQYIMAWWEFYPVPFKMQILLAKYVFSKTIAPPPVVTTSKNGASQSQSPALAGKKAQTLRLLRYTYLFAASTALLTHVITLTLSLSTVFFPTLFSPLGGSSAAFSLAPKNVFIPVSPLYHTSVDNLGEGLYHFLVWNMTVSNVAPLLWGLVQLKGAVERKGGNGEWEGWVVAGAKVVGLSLVGGPSAAAVWCCWRRDELVLGEGEERIG